MNVNLSDTIGAWSSINVSIDVHDDKHYNLGQKLLQSSQTRLRTRKNQNLPNTFDSIFQFFKVCLKFIWRFFNMN